jgi:hypothetical protein
MPYIVQIVIKSGQKPLFSVNWICRDLGRCGAQNKDTGRIGPQTEADFITRTVYETHLERVKGLAK